VLSRRGCCWRRSTFELPRIFLSLQCSSPSSQALRPIARPRARPSTRAPARRAAPASARALLRPRPPPPTQRSCSAASPKRSCTSILRLAHAATRHAVTASGATPRAATDVRCLTCTLHAAHRLALAEHLLSRLRSSVDLLKATQPKWVPCYRERDFADERGSHATRCSPAQPQESPRPSSCLQQHQRCCCGRAQVVDGALP